MRGTRFVRLFNEAGDQHGDIINGLRNNCRDTDRDTAALVNDLKQRGLLEDTIDHTELTYRFQGRDFRPTDVHGEVVHGLLA